MKVHQIFTHNNLRNFTYIIELDNRSALVIDPWDPVEVNKHLVEHNLQLITIINTHEHWDHTQGNEALVKQHGCEVWAHTNGTGKIPCLTRCLIAGEMIELDGAYQLRVLDTPGHTFAHLCFILTDNNKDIAVFTGDTLFNAGVGNCHGGSEEVLYQTISEQFHHLDDGVIVYPGHDYLENNLQFTLNYEPSNIAAKEWLVKVQANSYEAGNLQTTIADEKAFNTFFRLENEEVIASLELINPQPKQVFLSLRALRNNW